MPPRKKPKDKAQEEPGVQMQDLKNRKKKAEEDNAQATPAYKNTAPKSKDFEDIIKDFETKYGKDNYKNNTFIFPTIGEAEKFFDDQAKEPNKREFFVRAIDENGKYTGKNLFSLGTGKMYDGSLIEIKDKICKDREALEKANNPADKEAIQKYKLAETRLAMVIEKDKFQQTKSSTSQFTPENEKQEDTNVPKMQ
ncbi:hypothetical protein [Legionella gresilensis]|uniref:hypothetical protein n=1 Tax=Legionella gresilensis TaxID=91823 RepID=UPI00104193F9|nr:hypothetical protein [Legionella gresilensis]